MLWGWLQERRKVGSYDYAGCLSLPRVLYLRGDRLIQVRPSQTIVLVTCFIPHKVRESALDKTMLPRQEFLDCHSG